MTDGLRALGEFSLRFWALLPNFKWNLQLVDYYSYLEWCRKGKDSQHVLSLLHLERSMLMDLLQ